MSNYCGLFKGTVVSNLDPLGQFRIVATIPQLLGPGGQTGWALPAYPLTMIAPPVMGDSVWIMFENGDEDRPVYTGTWKPTSGMQIPESSVQGLPNDIATLYADIAAINAGSSGLPATTVTGPDAFGASSAVGTSTKYARADHDHGLPGDPTTLHAATSVTGPDTMGTAASVGTSTNYARQDHNHGLRPPFIGFLMGLVGNQSNSGGVIFFNHVDFDTSGGWNSGTGSWTIPTSAYYNIYFSGQAWPVGTFANNTQYSNYGIQLNGNNSPYFITSWVDFNGAPAPGFAASCVDYWTAGATINLQAPGFSSGTIIGGFYFGAFLVGY